MSESLLARVVKQHGADRLLEVFTPEQLNTLRYEWAAWARPEQLAPEGDWAIWLLLAGRGFGKSRTGGEWARSVAKSTPDAHIALVAPTAADARDVMVRAILQCSAPGEVTYEPSKRSLAWVNGATATTYSAEEPDRLRGPNHTHAWADECCAWQYLGEVWDMLAMTLRIGERPRLVVTTTPRPVEILTGDGRQGRRLGLLNRPDVVVTRGSTFDNRANLSAAFLAQMEQRYEGSRLGQQELYGVVLDDASGALFKRTDIDDARTRVGPPVCVRTVVALDPATTSGEDADETGIVVCAIDDRKQGYVLADYSGRYTPDEWAKRVAWAYDKHRADRVVAERNQGGEMIERILRVASPNIAYKSIHVRHGKGLRAEPVSALYEQHRVHHVGMHEELENQMCRLMPEGVLDGHDDRVDALVHALTELMLAEPAATYEDGEEISGRRW